MDKRIKLDDDDKADLVVPVRNKRRRNANVFPVTSVSSLSCLASVEMLQAKVLKTAGVSFHVVPA